MNDTKKFEWENFYYMHPTGCPNCGGVQLCPCENCVAHLPEGAVTWKWDDTGELCSCGHCGFTMHVDGWDDLVWQRLARYEDFDAPFKDIL